MTPLTDAEKKVVDDAYIKVCRAAARAHAEWMREQIASSNQCRCIVEPKENPMSFNQVPEIPYIRQTPEDQKRIDEAIREGMAEYMTIEDGKYTPVGLNSGHPHNGLTYRIKEPELLAPVGTVMLHREHALWWYDGYYNGAHRCCGSRLDLDKDIGAVFLPEDVTPLLPPGVDVWCARDRDGISRMFRHRPDRLENQWSNSGGFIGLFPKELCPDLTWEDEPRRYRMHLIPVEGE